MPNIRTANKRHNRAIVNTIARGRLAEKAATEVSNQSIGEPVKAAI